MIQSDFYYGKAATFQEILLTIHELILAAHPGIKHEIKYKVPFYTLKKDICYLDVQKGTAITGNNSGKVIRNLRTPLTF